jgi:uncharacterized protein (DUF2141 family)
MRSTVLSLALAILPIMANNISVEVKNLRGDGKLYIGLFNRAKSFKNISETYRNMVLDINSSSLKVIFRNIPNGVYAISLFHDKNGNGILDRNLFGIPIEGYGFSNNIHPIFRGANFEESKFELGGDKDMVIEMEY